ncbi:hypothetical protein [Erythrobacter sp. JK5]|uniref:hypothetical protein n=1 Tax=Erythrobacter sp. JK5 TaxID=2829500 RepID=UPI001BA8D13D|nr:hypothetical protein [Erythrobacter sp. JK5]QUL38203.1 hypothetical protein KDC96_01910 [Erythrobacter sp. JK5]
MKGFRLASALALAFTAPAYAQDEPASPEVAHASVEQLRHVIGEWEVVTTFYRDDGSEAGDFSGTYSFAWVVEDKVVQGISTIPEFAMASGILFYLRPSTQEIEMVSVGPDGQLWTMTGPMDSETRETPMVEQADGSTIKLRFTRFNVTPDRFESRMERSSDGGETWVLGNRQVFVRKEA